jgi:futalosine hydrolase
MNYLLVAATSLEISPFLNQLRAIKKGRSANQQIDILITGIGLTAATYAITNQLHLKRPGMVIQAGVAGCFNKSTPLGSVMAVKEDTIADQSVIELNKLKTLFDLKLVPHNQFPFKKGWLINPHTQLLKKIKGKAVKGISVNEITTSVKKVGFYQQAFAPVVESMEGAALHYTCLMENIPFLQVRSVSNYIGERNKNNWNMKESIINLNHTLVMLFNNL